MKRFSLINLKRQCVIFLSGWLIFGLLFLLLSAYPSPGQSPIQQAASSDRAEPLPPQSEQTTSITEQQTVSLPAQADKPALSLVYYNQKDRQWENDSYGGDSISGYGCGPTVCAMMISTLTSHKVTPAEMADWSVQNGCYIQGGGSYHTLIPLACKSYGLTVEGYQKSDRDKILAALADGALVCVIMGPGDFTGTGHFILLTGITEDGKLTVADPASRRNSQKAWDPDIIFDQAKTYAASGGPFWAAQSPQTTAR